MGISFFYSLNKFEILKSQIVGFTRTETALLSGAIIYYVDEGILSSVVVQILPGNSKEIFEKLAALNPNFFDFETSISQFEIHGIEKPKNQYKTNEVKQNRMSEFSPRTAIILNFDVKNKKFENYIHKNSVLGQNKLLIYPNTLQYIASGTPILTIESKEVVSMTESKDLIHFKLTGESLPERFSISKEIDLLSKLSSAGFDKKLFSSNT
jgi:hypothetical protein